MGQLMHTRGCVYDIQYHLILVTKYRKKVITNEIKTDLYDILRTIAINHDYHIKEMNGTEDHVHMLITAPPTISASQIAKQLKGGSAKSIFTSHPELKNQLWNGHFWSPSYYVSTTNENTETRIQQYIQNQETNKYRDER